ncbi:MAG: Ig-like domain-containing protein, partial [Acidimicrobiia bacterium]|nr:Ig-like domain-containing protein [Acidimicrobiia bacterium]
MSATDDGIPNLSGQTSFVWVVTDDNQDPVAANDLYELDEQTTLTVPAPGVLANDFDPDDEALTAVLVTPPSHGRVVLNPDGSFTYTHTGGDATDDSFTYRATDVRGGTGLAVVTLRINENQAPVAALDLLTIDEDTTGNIDPLSNDSDPEGRALLLVGIEQPSRGVATLEEDGTITFTPPADWNGRTSFAYLVSDGRKSSRGLVSVLVIAVNDPPVGGPDLYRLVRYGPAVLDVLANDTDVDGDVLSVIAIRGVEHALAEIVDGTLTYNAFSGWFGTETVIYTLTDGTVSVDVPVSVTLAEEALAAANQLSEQVGAPDVPFDNPEAAFDIGSISLASPKGISLLAGAFFDSFDALKLPLVFLVLALLWALIFGGLFSSPWFLFGARRRFWSIVLVDRESMATVHSEPDFGSTAVYNYPPTAQNIRSTGAPKRRGKTTWMPVDTPNGEGWIDAHYLTQEVDEETFAKDQRPDQLAARFVTALTAGNVRAVQKLVSNRG